MADKNAKENPAESRPFAINVAKTRKRPSHVSLV